MTPSLLDRGLSVTPTPAPHRTCVTTVARDRGRSGRRRNLPGNGEVRSQRKRHSPYRQERGTHHRVSTCTTLHRWTHRTTTDPRGPRRAPASRGKPPDTKGRSQKEARVVRGLLRRTPDTPGDTTRDTTRVGVPLGLRDGSPRRDRVEVGREGVPLRSEGASSSR